MVSVHRCEDASVPHTFIVRRTAQAGWCVSTPDDSAGGLFASAAAARCFARGEARSHRSGAVILYGDGSVDIESFEDAHKVEAIHVEGSVR